MTEAEHELLARFASGLGGEAEFEPIPDFPAPSLTALPTRVPGDALHRGDELPPPAIGPRGILLDCGTSRLTGYTHVLWISPQAEAVLGSEGFERLGEIVGRVYGVTGFAWEGIERLHLAAGEIAWDELLAESRDALADFMASRR